MVANRRNVLLWCAATLFAVVSAVMAVGFASARVVDPPAPMMRLTDIDPIGLGDLVQPPSRPSAVNVAPTPVVTTSSEPTTTPPSEAVVAAAPATPDGAPTSQPPPVDPEPAPPVPAAPAAAPEPEAPPAPGPAEPEPEADAPAPRPAPREVEPEDDEPEPEPEAPAEPTVVTRSASSIGGNASFRAVDGRLELAGASPASGFTVEVDQDDDEVTVTFRSSGHTSKITAIVEDGELVVAVKEKSKDRSGDDGDDDSDDDDDVDGSGDD